jgi:hypothetical protein
MTPNESSSTCDQVRCGYKRGQITKYRSTRNCSLDRRCMFFANQISIKDPGRQHEKREAARKDLGDIRRNL